MTFYDQDAEENSHSDLGWLAVLLTTLGVMLVVVTILTLSGTLR